MLPVLPSALAKTKHQERETKNFPPEPSTKNEEPRTRNQERPPMTNILGINAYHGDASASLVIDGQLVAAVEEERFNRIKH